MPAPRAAASPGPRRSSAGETAPEDSGTLEAATEEPATEEAAEQPGPIPRTGSDVEDRLRWAFALILLGGTISRSEQLRRRAPAHRM